MVGIQEIASYIPEKRISNYNKKEKFGITDDFIKNKIGVESVAVKDDSEDCSDLCVKAFQNLQKKITIDKDEIDIIVVVTQNPDYNLPHTSAIVHGQLDLPQSCAAFDVSLGCSGFVYGMSVIESFMKCNNMKSGLLFTSDPYSKIIDVNDKNTSLLFGDAATVSLFSHDPVYVSKEFLFGTKGKHYHDLICENKTLTMNGRAISTFGRKLIPAEIMKLLDKIELSIDEIDQFLFHPGSLFMIKSLAHVLNLDESKYVYDILHYGNTVSSSIPILLEKQFIETKNKLLLLSGFGVGLSWGNAVIKRVK